MVKAKQSIHHLKIATAAFGGLATTLNKHFNEAKSSVNNFQPRARVTDLHLPAVGGNPKPQIRTISNGWKACF
jgi:hypothetical protein